MSIRKLCKYTHMYICAVGVSLHVKLKILPVQYTCVVGVSVQVRLVKKFTCSRIAVSVRKVMTS